MLLKAAGGQVAGLSALDGPDGVGEGRRLK
jgi:hypothetical protein